MPSGFIKLLAKYEVVASEPLHDLKGYIINLITELPYVLPPGDTVKRCTRLIECCLSKVKKSDADLRRVVIQIYLLLKDLEPSSKILLLLQTGWRNIIFLGRTQITTTAAAAIQCLLVAHGTLY